MKNKIIIGLTIIMACLTGCSSNGDYISELANKNNPGFKVGTENYIDSDYYCNYVKSYAADELFEILCDTSFKDYIEYEDAYFSMDTSAYLVKICEEEGLELHELDKKERFALEFSNEEKYWKGYNWVQNDDCIYLVNPEGQVISGTCYILFSKNEEVKNAMISAGLAPMLAQFEFIDNSILENKKAYPNKFTDVELEIMDCRFEMSGKYFKMHSSYYAYYNKKIDYLTNLNQLDAWVNVSSTSFDNFDTLTMKCFEVFPFDNEEPYMRMDLVGSEGELQEIKITYYKTQEKIPDNCKYTIIRCLEEMGCDKATAEKFLNEEFSGKGKVGDLNYVVESLDNENNWIKIYR